MKLGLAIWLLLLAGRAGGAPQADKVQIVLLGEIRKIDAKAGTLLLRERVFPEGGARRSPPRPPDLGPDFPPSPPPRGTRGGTQVETKILYSAETRITLAGKKVGIEALRVGDRVRIMSLKKDKTLIASEIETLRRKHD